MYILLLHHLFVDDSDPFMSVYPNMENHWTLVWYPARKFLKVHGQFKMISS